MTAVSDYAQVPVRWRYSYLFGMRRATIDQDGHQICIHDYNSYRTRHARAYMKSPPVGKLGRFFMNREALGGMAVTF